jgi:hypothetical protein
MIFWEIAVRQIPFNGHSDPEVIEAVKNGQRPAWADNYNGPQGFKELVCDCWHPKPMSRPPLQKIIDTLMALRKELEEQKIEE